MGVVDRMARRMSRMSMMVVVMMMPIKLIVLHLLEQFLFLEKSTSCLALTRIVK